ncbi:hypothetical protein H4R35_005056 [Dimargaris xerosporica]|nr:hypothetical protein H4R35_005056 [Dimargaris xerosporica]
MPSPRSSKGPPLPVNVIIDAPLDATAFFNSAQALSPTALLQTTIAPELHPALPAASVPNPSHSSSLPLGLQDLVSRRAYLETVLRLSMASGALLPSVPPSQAQLPMPYAANGPSATQSTYAHQNVAPNLASSGSQMYYYNLMPQSTGQTAHVPISSPSTAYGSSWYGQNVSLPSVVAPQGPPQYRTYPLQQRNATYPPSPAALDGYELALPTQAPQIAVPGPARHLHLAAPLPLAPSSSTTEPLSADQEYVELLEQVLKYEANNQFMHFGGVYRQRMRNQCSSNMQTEFSEKLSSFWKNSRPVEKELFDSKRLLEKWWINDAQHVIRHMLGKKPEKNKKPDNEVMLYAPDERVKFAAAAKQLSTSNPWYNNPTDPISGSIPPTAQSPSQSQGLVSSDGRATASLDEYFHPRMHLKYEPPRHPRDASLMPAEIDHAFDRWMAEQGADHLTFVVHMELMDNPVDSSKTSGGTSASLA